MWGRTLVRATTVALWMFVVAGCDGADETDAGSGDVDAGAAGDAGAPVDPTTAVFVETSATGDGPWGLWGYSVAAIDDSTAIVMGGTDAGGAGNTVYDVAWRVSVAVDGTLSATQVPGTGPVPFYCGCMAYDAARDVVVMFGGRDLMVPSLDPATWELDLATDTWTEITTATQPQGTLGCAMAYSPGTETTYMFGGSSLSLGGPHDKTYRYDVATGAWVELPATGPLARYDGAFFADRDGRDLLLFGGSFAAMGAAFYADLWRFDVDDESWTEIALPEGPEGRRTPWVVHDPARNGLYIAFGYDGRMTPMGDMHYADLDALTWTQVEIDFDTGPVGRGFAFALPGGEGALGTVMAGYGATQPVLSYWRLVRP